MDFDSLNDKNKCLKLNYLSDCTPKRIDNFLNYFEGPIENYFRKLMERARTTNNLRNSHF